MSRRLDLIEAIRKKTLDRAPKRLQDIKDMTSKYSISRARICSSRRFLVEPPFPTPVSTTKRNLKSSRPLKYLVMPDVRIREIPQHTNDDLALQPLKQTITEGWPDHESALPPLVVPYFSIRDELAVTDGLVSWRAAGDSQKPKITN